MQASPLWLTFFFHCLYSLHCVYIFVKVSLVWWQVGQWIERWHRISVAVDSVLPLAWCIWNLHIFPMFPWISLVYPGCSICVLNNGIQSWMSPALCLQDWISGYGGLDGWIITIAEKRAQLCRIIAHCLYEMIYLDLFSIFFVKIRLNKAFC